MIHEDGPFPCQCSASLNRSIRPLSIPSEMARNTSAEGTDQTGRAKRRRNRRLYGAVLGEVAGTPGNVDNSEPPGVDCLNQRRTTACKSRVPPKSGAVTRLFVLTVEGSHEEKVNGDVWIG